ncbi:enoyl-CoA hydratase/isomerase family protein [Haliangium ochraceum]|uniref:Enoyl-CoA hydratase/isomerase n=1 Tax=Haliangium ochraceum (strain DSM 14365 / JCM 11303 / SMP-2) TaxID=502025 RepID=D0LQD1_HALO1|nr:enoyl-CoA hydratase/isomerase family protein [Haliangium ochraceum]ACY18940.1 Enoyl-CoA hydratase/isomerase [Haliangium ochraceum DSM 14365]
MASASASASYTAIEYDDRNVPVAKITLNRPDKHNAIGPLMIGELMHALEAARHNEAARVIVLTGAGSSFCAGGDLGAMSPAAGVPVQPRSFSDLFPAMHNLGKPIIAMVRGNAMGGGLGLMLGCDLVVASADARFGLPEVKVGVWPMIVIGELVRNIGRKNALELMLTGKRVGAEEAAAMGMINRVVAPEQLEAETQKLAETVAEFSPATLALGLRAFYNAQDMEFEAGLAYLEKELGKVLALEDAAEGIRAFLQKRKPEWKSR